MKINKRHVTSGLIAGLVMIIGIGIPLLFGSGLTNDEAYVLAMVALCFYAIWIPACSAFGVWLFSRSGHPASIKDGLIIGGISSVYLIVPILGLGILRETILYNPDDLVRGGAIITLGGLAATVFFSACFGGFLGTLFFNKPRIAATSEQAEASGAPVSDEQVQKDVAQTGVAVGSGKSPLVAALLSLFLFGGAGQIYLGQWKKGLGIILTNFLVPVFGLAALLIGPGDAYGIAQKMKKGEAVGELEFAINWKVVVLVILFWLIGVPIIYLGMNYKYLNFSNFHLPGPPDPAVRLETPTPEASVSFPPTRTAVPPTVIPATRPASSTPEQTAVLQVDLAPLLVQVGDLPVNMRGTDIHEANWGRYVEDIPRPDKVTSQVLTSNGVEAGYVVVILYVDETDGGKTYSMNRSVLDFVETPDIGEVASEFSYPKGYFMKETDLIFVRCHSFVSIQFAGMRDIPGIEAYAKKLDARLAQAVCP
jgi:TM2 domain-containing membrane protein YozV